MRKFGILLQSMEAEYVSESILWLVTTTHYASSVGFEDWARNADK